MTYKQAVYRVAHLLVQLNLLGMLASVIWIVSQSRWVSVGVGLFVLMFSNIVIPLILAPSAIFSNFMVFYEQNQRVHAAKVMFFCSIAYLVLFLALWVGGVFHISLLTSGNSATAPSLLWGATVAITPLLVWVRGDENNPFMVTMVGISQLSVILLSVYKYIEQSADFLHYFAFLFVFIGFFATVIYFATKSKKS